MAKISKFTPTVTKSTASGSTSKNKVSQKKSKFKDEDLVENFIIIPPDGGWGWLIVSASFFCNFATDGVIYSFGMFLPDLSEAFNVHQTKVAVINSIMTGFYFILGPLTCALTNKYGFRLIALTGSGVSVAAFLLSTVMVTLPPFVIILGVLGGIGLNMIYVPTIIVVGFYFERWRALATSIAVCGTSVGMITFPLIFRNLLHDYSWKIKFYIIASLFALCGLCAMLFRPLRPTRIVEEQRRGLYEGDPSSTDLFRLDMEPLKIQPIFTHFHNATFPTEADVKRSSSVFVSFAEESISDYSTLVATLPPSTSTPSISIKSTLKSNTSRTSKLESQSEKLPTVIEEDSEQELIKKCYHCKRCCKSCRYCFRCCSKEEYSVAPLNRPMYRDDIFFSASIASAYSRSMTPKASQKRSMMEYQLSVARVASERDSETKRLKCCSLPILRTLATMLDFSLLKSPSFILLTLSGFFAVLGLYSPFVYMTQRAEDKQINKEMSSYLLSALGISNTVGRISCGIISSHPRVDALVISYVSLFIAGLFTICSNYFSNLGSQMFYAVIFGLSIACLAALKPIILVEMLGLENLTNAFGLQMLFQGIACFLGVPIAGAFIELTQMFDASFVFAGVCFILSAVLLIPVKKVNSWEKANQKVATNKSHSKGQSTPRL